MIWDTVQIERNSQFPILIDFFFLFSQYFDYIEIFSVIHGNLAPNSQAVK